MLKEYTDNDSTGYFFEVDITYPSDLHELHNNLPLAPESLVIDGIKKLAPNFNHKKNYVCHAKNLKYYVSKGLKITKVHRCLSFHQEAYLKPYIEKNTLLR